MNPIRLQTEDGKKVGLWLCGACHVAHIDPGLAESCCRPKACDMCGETVQRLHWLQCDACRAAKAEEADQARWDRAVKVAALEYDGPVYDDDHDRHHHSIQDLIDEIEDDPELGRPRVYACTKHRTQMDANAIIEHAVEEQYEDAASHVSDEATEALQAMLDTWCAAYGLTHYEADYSRAVVYDVPTPQPEPPRRPGRAPDAIELRDMCRERGWWVCPACKHIEIAKGTRCSACGYQGAAPEPTDAIEPMSVPEEPAP